jgi:hypothetical protein
LEQFLEFAFGVFECGDDRQGANSAMELAQNKFTGGIKAAVEKNRAEKGFESVRKSGRAVATTVEFFAPTEDEMLAEAKLAGVFCEGAAIDEFGAGFREGTFAEGGEILVELASKNELEDSITEEFEPLIGLDRNTLFVSD